MLPLAIGLAAMLNAIFLYYDGLNSLAGDFRVFWTAAQAVHPYAPADMPFVNPPTTLLLIQPLGWFPFGGAFALWTALSMLLFAWAVHRVAGLIPALASFLACASLHSLMMGNITAFLGGVTFLAFTLPPPWRGALIGAVIAIKPQLLFLAPLYFVARRDWATVAGIIGGGVALVAAQLLIMGPSPWRDWLAGVGAFQDLMLRTTTLKDAVSLGGRGMGMGLSPLPFQLLGLAIGLWVILRTRAEGASLIAVLAGASMIAAPTYSHYHDMIILMPAMVLALRKFDWATVPALLCFAGLPAIAPYALIVWLIIGLLDAFHGKPSTAGRDRSA